MVIDSEEIAIKAAKEITESLDSLIAFINKCQVERELNNDELSSFIIQLPLNIYAITEKCEALGLKEDNAKSVKTLAYAKVYNELNSGTVENRKNTALMSVQEEQQVELICKTSYNIVKTKINMAYELLNSLKKVLNVRIAELQITKVDKGDLYDK